MRKVRELARVKERVAIVHAIVLYQSPEVQELFGEMVLPDLRVLYPPAVPVAGGLPRGVIAASGIAVMAVIQKITPGHAHTRGLKKGIAVVFK